MKYFTEALQKQHCGGLRISWLLVPNTFPLRLKMHFQALSSPNSFGALRVKSYSLSSRSQVQSLKAKQGLPLPSNYTPSDVLEAWSLSVGFVKCNTLKLRQLSVQLKMLIRIQPARASCVGCFWKTEAKEQQKPIFGTKASITEFFNCEQDCWVWICNKQIPHSRQHCSGRG